MQTIDATNDITAPIRSSLGRPSLYSKELADNICAEIASGHSIRTICKDDSMPCMATIFSWLRTNRDFLEQYEASKIEQADALAEEMLDIADNGSNDWMLTNDEENAGYRANGENIQRSRLRVDTRKWIASKLKPKKYGDNLKVEHAGEFTNKTLPDQNLLEIAKRIAFILSRGMQLQSVVIDQPKKDPNELGAVPGITGNSPAGQ